jgi:hypothetical protein
LIPIAIEIGPASCWTLTSVKPAPAIQRRWSALVPEQEPLLVQIPVLEDVAHDHEPRVRSRGAAVAQSP